jgi:hypothetical protein
MQNSLQRQNNFKFNSRWFLAGLLLLVSVALFPYGLIPFDRLLSFSPAFRHGFYQFSATWQAHVVGHAAIFFMMGTAVLLRFSSLLYRPKLYFGLMVTLGILQEFFQIIGFKHRGLVFDDFFDVFVDLTGALIVFLLMRFIVKISAGETSNEVMS